MTVVLVKEICAHRSVYLSVIKREKECLSLLYKFVYVFFSKFRSRRLFNERYTLSRYSLIKFSKRLVICKKFNYCLSHAGKYTAILLSSEKQQISVDLEPINRHLSGSLKLKIRKLYPDLLIQELIIILILESMVKLSVFKNQIDLSKGLDNLCLVKIIRLKSDIFEVSIKSIKVYSKIYICEDLYICVTMDSTTSDVFL